MTKPIDIWRNAYRHPGNWERSFPPLSVVAQFEASAATYRDSPLIDFLGRQFSYGETYLAARHVAAGLQALGIAKGDRVGLYLPNVPHYVAAYYGALMVGAVIVNFSPLYTVEELADQVRDSGTRLLFTISARQLLPNAIAVMEIAGLEHLVVGSVAGALSPAKSMLYRLFRKAEVVERPNDPRVMSFSRLIASGDRFVAPEIVPEADLAMIQYTGGTTGTPKGAMLTHQNLSANARQLIAIDPDRPTPDRVIAALPLFHIFANIAIMHRSVLEGGEIVMLPRFEAGQVLAAIERTQATNLPGVPTMFQALLDHPKLHSTNLSSLRICISGGAPLSAGLKARFEHASGAIITEGYGLTESCIASVNPVDGPNRRGTIGQPVPGTLIRLVDRDDPSRDAPDGAPGEITIAGPQVMVGYWNRPELDSSTFIHGALRTGDVGAIDDDGYIRIVDRMKDMIAVGGFKVFPSAVEAVLLRHPAVKEAIVIGVPDAYHGEMPKAFVTLVPGTAITGDVLRIWLNGHVGKHERVIAVEIRDALPKTMIGKPSRKDLIAEERARAIAKTA